MEWSKEDIIRLIETYQKKDLIWDPKHVHHYNKKRKRDSWEQIAKEMGTSVDVCKKKMEYLLAALRREKMKMKRSTGTGKGVHEVYISSWFAFESMKFLWDKNQPKPTSSTGSQEVGAATSPTPSDLVSDTQESASRNPTPPLEPCQRQGKRARTDIEERTMQQALPKRQSTPSSQKNIDDDSYFMGQLVENELRAMNNRQRVVAKKLISDVLFYGNLDQLRPTSHVLCQQQDSRVGLVSTSQQQVMDGDMIDIKMTLDEV